MRGVEEPVYFWYPDFAPSSTMFYTGDGFPEWKSGGRRKGALGSLDLNGDKIATEEPLLTDRHQRVRDTRQGPNGEICLLSGNELLRLTPK
jgi:glucose/arabinose dehydrogenase